MPLPAIAIGAGLKTAGAFLLANWKLVLLAVLIIGVWWKWSSLTDEIEDLRTENVELAEKNTSLIVDNGRLEKIIDAQSDAVNQIAQLSEKVDERMNVLGQELTTQRRQFNFRLDQLREQPAPQTTGESVDYILEGLPYLKSTGDQP